MNSNYQGPGVHYKKLVQRIDSVHLVNCVQIVLVSLVPLLSETDQRLTTAQQRHVVLAAVVLKPAYHGYASLRSELGYLSQIVVRNAVRYDENARIRVAKLEVLIDAREAPIARLGHAHPLVLLTRVVHEPARVVGEHVYRVGLVRFGKEVELIAERKSVALQHFEYLLTRGHVTRITVAARESQATSVLAANYEAIEITLSYTLVAYFFHAVDQAQWQVDDEARLGRLVEL